MGADLPKSMVAGGCASGITAALFAPLECVKTRLQLQHDPSFKPIYKRGVLHTLNTIRKQDGLFTLWSHGFVGFVARDCLYPAFRIGLYPTVRAMLGQNVDKERIPLHSKILAGAITGGTGSAIANPLDVVRVRMTVEGGRIGQDGRLLTGLRKGHRPRWSSHIDCFVQLARTEGINGLWRGVHASVSRAALLSAAQLSSYDHTKTILRRRHLVDEGSTLHFFAAAVSGFVASVACHPADVVKSRLMASTGRSSLLGIIWHIIRSEGILGFMHGWGASYSRIGLTMFIQMPIVEKIRYSLGVGSL